MVDGGHFYYISVCCGFMGHYCACSSVLLVFNICLCGLAYVVVGF